LATLDLVSLYLEHADFAALAVTSEDLALFLLNLDHDNTDRLLTSLCLVAETHDVEADGRLFSTPCKS
jgi:hypothetical protein